MTAARLLAAFLAVASPVAAAGPLLVNGAGTPLVWAPPVPFNPDLGPLGVLDNATALAHVSASFGVWAAVPTASISYANAGALPVDVTAANYASWVGVCGDGVSPIVFDTDGSIVDDLLGFGASNYVLGFAGPDCGDYTDGTIHEGSAVLNGRFLDGIDTPSNPEVSVAEFDQVFVHEFGHYVNLDHSQIGRDEAFDADATNDDAIATMFPISVNGVAQASLALDDRVSLSMLYPAPSFATGAGRITGSVLRADGTTPFQGAYVIARRVDDPRRTAVGVASGARWFPASPGGPPPPALEGAFELAGLPPGTYTVEVEPIDSRFDGGSSVGPLDPPADLPAPPEYWNGASEAGTDPPDDPAAAVPIGVAAGVTLAGTNIVLNTPPPAPNDACAAPTVVVAAPYHDTVDIAAARTDPGDPVQSCSTAGAVNFASVWYRFTAPVNGSVRADTLGSTYDTVLTAYSGACGALVEQACSDDLGASGILDSELTVDVLAGQTYLFEATRYAAAGEGVLHFALAFTPSDDTGVAPPDATAARCQSAVARAFGKYLVGVLKCHMQMADAAAKGLPYDDEPCESEPGGAGMKERFDGAIARLATKCPSGACYVANAATLQGLAGSFLDQRNGSLYCAGTTPFGGDDTGFVPPDVATAKCEDSVAKAVGKYMVAVLRCHVKTAARWMRGMAADDEACEDLAGTKFDASVARLVAVCPACALANAPGLREIVEQFLDGTNGQIYCQP